MALAIDFDGTAADIEAVETAFVTHWRNFGLWPGASLHDDDGILWYESAIAHLPYNAVIRTHIGGSVDVERAIARVVEDFRSRQKPFMWVRLPSDRPEDLGRRLAGHGLDLVEQATGMILEMRPEALPPSRSVARIAVAEGEPALRHYEELIRTYWSVPDDARHHIAELNRHWSGKRSPGVRFVAYLDGEPVGKLFLNLAQTPGQASIYGVTVLPPARGRGIASAMMSEALRRASESGARRIVLHSSNMARSLYLRMGFREVCMLDVYATGPIFGTHHH